MALHHVNFHTARNVPVFEHPDHDAMMRETIATVALERRILVPAWELMPTYVHLIVQDFPDLTRGAILQYLEGDTSRRFFHAYPHLREDLQGGHLWARGYWATCITSHRQFCATIAYVQANRSSAGLTPPAPLDPYGT